jgi:hypothetical protein
VVADGMAHLVVAALDDHLQIERFGLVHF